MAKIDIIVKIRVPKGLTKEELLSKIEKDLKSVDFNPRRDYYKKIELSRGLLTKAQRVKVGRNQEAIVVRGTVNEAQYKALRRAVRDRRSPIISVWKDTPIHLHSWDYPGESRGSMDQILNHIEAKWVWAKGYTGRGIVIGVVDGGVHECAFGDKMFKKNGVVDGWPPPETLEHTDSKPGDMTLKCHATTMAFDALSVCPDAKILDIGLDRVTPGEKGTLGLAHDAYLWAIKRFETDRRDGPHVLLNSWGVLPEVDPDYATNPDHDFTLAVQAAIEAGILVCFSAGNCGLYFPDPKCRSGQNTGTSIEPASQQDLSQRSSEDWYKGPDCSIWGANGLPEVITVGAASIRNEWFGFSSQGRSWLCIELGVDMTKPDLCAPAEFAGFRNTLDKGTSAANALVAGVLGLLAEIGERNQQPITQTDAKRHLQSGAQQNIALAPPTPNDPHPGVLPDHSWGHGLLNARGAYQSLTGDTSSLSDLTYLTTPIFTALLCHNEPSECRCFIATAAFGSTLDTHVQFLRDFRDEVVLASSFAPPFQRLLDMYYRFSPPVAAKMRQNKFLKNLIKFTIVYPFIHYLEASVSLKQRLTEKRKDFSPKDCSNNI